MQYFARAIHFNVHKAREEIFINGRSYPSRSTLIPYYWTLFLYNKPWDKTWSSLKFSRNCAWSRMKYFVSKNLFLHHDVSVKNQKEIKNSRMETFSLHFHFSMPRRFLMISDIFSFHVRLISSPNEIQTFFFYFSFNSTWLLLILKLFFPSMFFYETLYNLPFSKG